MPGTRASGSVARIEVHDPARCRIEAPIKGGDSVGKFAQSRASSRICATDAVVEDRDDDVIVLNLDTYESAGGSGVFCDVRERLGYDIEDADLHGFRWALV